MWTQSCGPPPLSQRCSSHLLSLQDRWLMSSTDWMCVQMEHFHRRYTASRSHLVLGIYSVEDLDALVGTKLPTMNPPTLWEVSKCNGVCMHARMEKVTIPPAFGCICVCICICGVSFCGPEPLRRKRPHHHRQSACSQRLHPHHRRRKEEKNCLLN